MIRLRLVLLHVVELVRDPLERQHLALELAALEHLHSALEQVAVCELDGGQLVFVPPGGISGAPYGSLLGRPVIPIEQASALGDLGDIILADMNGYVLAQKGGVQSDVSIHVRFVYDESVFRFVLRIDGQPLRASALTPYKGGATATQSHFVTLEAR